MATTFLKRQKEMKRLEKQREKAERRAQKKLASRAGDGVSVEDTDMADIEPLDPDLFGPSESDPKN
jgi:hypothetical protein